MLNLGATNRQDGILGGIRFCKSLALNIGAYQAKSSTLFFLDTDIILNENIFIEALSYMNNHSYVVVSRVFESNKNIQSNQELQQLKRLSYFIELEFANKTINIETNSIRFNDGSRSASGLIFLKKHDFLTINGMNSNLHYWGWEDIDLQIRLQVKCNLFKHIISGSVTHVSHDDSVRNLINDDRLQSESNNFKTCLAAYDTGDFYGTYRDDVSQCGEGLCIKQ